MWSGGSGSGALRYKNRKKSSGISCFEVLDVLLKASFHGGKIFFFIKTLNPSPDKIRNTDPDPMVSASFCRIQNSVQNVDWHDSTVNISQKLFGFSNISKTSARIRVADPH